MIRYELQARYELPFPTGIPITIPSTNNRDRRNLGRRIGSFDHGVYIYTIIDKSHCGTGQETLGSSVLISAALPQSSINPFNSTRLDSRHDHLQSEDKAKGNGTETDHVGGSATGALSGSGAGRRAGAGGLGGSSAGGRSDSRAGSRGGAGGSSRGSKASGDRDGDASGLADAGEDGDKLCGTRISIELGYGMDTGGVQRTGLVLGLALARHTGGDGLGDGSLASGALALDVRNTAARLGDGGDKAGNLGGGCTVSLRGLSLGGVVQNEGTYSAAGDLGQVRGLGRDNDERSGSGGDGGETHVERLVVGRVWN